ncbi:hypothetical protein IU501_34800 [Nocardia otitidiscaviarum]|uniref:hypothetical protein n=1 Tax=Nocardia otitidiscaviarum TaxID=1823 RepID=UPI00189543A1|nr:hypothetical protein [Nocardia otitidiscaviarum]MBF6138141.1 hypothetical protein [Nocardia otitidiscaviarum]
MSEWVEGPPPRGDYGCIAPGTLLDTKSQGLMLVGDMSPRGGQCDCCNVDLNDADIVAHRVIWSEPEVRSDRR